MGMTTKTTSNIKGSTMKNTFLVIAVAAIITSCSQQTPEASNITKNLSGGDTIAMSDYNEWKAQQEQPGSQQTFTSGGVDAPVPVDEPTQKPQVIYREVPARQPRIARAPERRAAPVYKTPEPEPRTSGITKPAAPETAGGTREPYGRDGNDKETSSAGTAGTSGTGAGESGNSNTEGEVSVDKPAATPAKKEGMSKATKGGVIGGASGAVLGAIFSKNKVKGAVIGGVVGAAGGYIFGHSQDKKDGRN
jgi:hypothetical protein